MNPQVLEHSNKLIALLPTVAAHGMQSFDRLITLAQCAFDVQQLHGDVCEFGCNAGGTARWLRELLPSKHLWLYDTFTGHPADGPGDSFKKGAMAASRVTTMDDVDDGKLTIVPGNVMELSEASSMVPQTIILAHVDLDTYEGTLHVLNLVWPRMNDMGYIVVDDYHDPNYPGVKQAVDEFTESIPFAIARSSLGCAGKTRSSVIIEVP